MANPERLKAAAAQRALELVRPGMLVGLGTGSTAAYFIDGVARLVRQGMSLTAVATSRATAARAQTLGIQLADEIDRPIDLAVDGADEIDPDLNLIKGRGGALLREKLVAAAASRFVVIADQSKLVPRLGRGPIPVEIVPFLWAQTVERLLRHGTRCAVRGGSQPFLTDNGNLIADLEIEGGISDPPALDRMLKGTLGAVEHGLFCGLTAACIIAGDDGIDVRGVI